MQLRWSALSWCWGSKQESCSSWLPVFYSSQISSLSMHAIAPRSTYPHMKVVKAINPKHFYSPTQTFKAQRHCRRGAEWWFPGCCSLATAPKPLCWPTKVESKAQLACPSAPLLMAIMLTWGQNSFLYIKKTPSPYMPLSYLISFYKNLCSKMNAADVYSSEKRLRFEATQ